MKRRLLIICCCLCGCAVSFAAHRHWTVADGLLTNEVHQIIELPNGQMLVNCEGIFCLFDGQRFKPVQYDRTKSHALPAYANYYGHLWQGDSLLWIHDLVRLYLFEAHHMSFRYELADALDSPVIKRFQRGETGNEPRSAEMQALLDSIAGGRTLSSWATDHQGGRWFGTREDGIYYLPPPRRMAETAFKDDTLIREAREYKDSQGRYWSCRVDGLICSDQNGRTVFNSSNTEGFDHDNCTFILELEPGRYLACNTMNRVGYLYPDRHLFVSLYEQNGQLHQYRYIGGACKLDRPEEVAVYTQNGAFVLNTSTDSLSDFPCEREIARWSDKFNCMMLDQRNRLWVGTQNGLFCLTQQNSSGTYRCQRVEGLTNDCIRSLVEDAAGDVWAGTSCGISRITPMVTNFGESDGIPTVSMTERAATRLSDGSLLFIHGSTTYRFQPEWMEDNLGKMQAVVVGMSVNGEELPLSALQAGKISLPHDRNNLSISFSALNYLSPEHTRYRYRMKGIDKEWIGNVEGKGKLSVSYNALPPGTYQLLVEVSVNEGEWGPQSSLEIKVNPPIWLTWWAKAIYLLLLAALTTYCINIYLRKRRIRMERENEAKVNHLFELREEARRQFAANVKLEASKLGINADEETFVNQLLKATEANLSNGDYNVDQLARDVAVSRASLYKRMQNMLGITPSDFIRNVRLKRAALLLSESNLPVAEIAERVGYNTPRIFSSNFKKMFGVTPKEYRNPGSPDTD